VIALSTGMTRHRERLDGMTPPGLQDMEGPSTPCVESSVLGAFVMPRLDRRIGSQDVLEMTIADDTVAVHAPAWLGVGASTRSLFDHVIHLPETADRHPDDLSDDELDEFSALLVEAGIRHVVLSGGDLAQLRLANLLRRQRPAIRCDVIWHSSFVQFREDAQWESFKAILRAADEGTITKIGVLKKGMDQLLRTRGYAAELLYNHVPHLPAVASHPGDGAFRVGIWPSNVNYRKLPHAMLAALAQVPGVKLEAANLDDRCRELIDLLGLDTGGISSRLLDHEVLLDRIRATHLTLSVTFSEACPMLPLESYSLGVPCLIGPTSHLFEDDDYLRERSIVPFPDRADVIAEYTRRALDERTELVDAYRSWAPTYNRRARAAVRSFLA